MRRPSIARRIVIVAVAAALAAAAGAGTASAGIRWETKLDRAATEARASNRPILIEFWAVWCEICKEMDRDVYSSERVATAMAKVHPVRIDIDREPGLARKYEVAATPTLVLTDSYGRELFRFAGALPHDRMVHLLEALPPDVSRINELSRAVAEKKDDFAALSGLGGELRQTGFFRTSSEYYGRALRTRDGRRTGEVRTAILIGMERNALELRLYVDAAKLAEGALAEVRGTPAEPEVLLDLGRALLGQDRAADGRKVLQDLAARFGGTPAAAAAADLLAAR